MGQISLYGVPYRAVVEFLWIPQKNHHTYYTAYYIHYFQNDLNDPKPRIQYLYLTMYTIQYL